jgi:hypothetical protein
MTSFSVCATPVVKIFPFLRVFSHRVIPELGPSGKVGFFIDRRFVL